MTEPVCLLDRVELESRLAAELSFAFRHGTTLGVLLVVPEQVRAGDEQRQRAFVERLRAMVRIEDPLARFDDQTYAIIVRGIPPSAMRQLAERLCALMLQRPPRPATGARIVISIGIAVAEPLSDDESVQALLRRAAVALAHARSAGGGRVKA